MPDSQAPPCWPLAAALRGELAEVAPEEAARPASALPLQCHLVQLHVRPYLFWVIWLFALGSSNGRGQCWRKSHWGKVVFYLRNQGHMIELLLGKEPRAFAVLTDDHLTALCLTSSNSPWLENRKISFNSSSTIDFLRVCARLSMSGATQNICLCAWLAVCVQHTRSPW